LVLAGAVLKAKQSDTPAAPHGTEMPNLYKIRSPLPITPTRNLKCAKRKEGGSRISSICSPSSEAHAHKHLDCAVQTENCLKK